MPELWLKKMEAGYRRFRQKYAIKDDAIMSYLACHGQKPEIMFVACCDSRVDPALILQCEPGDLFVVRNVANIIPPYEKADQHYGTIAALEFAICHLDVKHLIILGHSQCGGIQALLNHDDLMPNNFITPWMSIIASNVTLTGNADDCAKEALLWSYKNCLTFPWIKQRVDANTLQIQRWFFDIKQGKIMTYCANSNNYVPFGEDTQDNGCSNSLT